MRKLAEEITVDSAGTPAIGAGPHLRRRFDADRRRDAQIRIRLDPAEEFCIAIAVNRASDMHLGESMCTLTSGFSRHGTSRSDA